MYNADVLLGAVMRGLSAASAACAPVLRMSIAYPLRSRFRTGVDARDVHAGRVHARRRARRRPASFVHGFNDVEASAAASTSAPDLAGQRRSRTCARRSPAAPGHRRRRLPRRRRASPTLPVEARQVGTCRRRRTTSSRGLDAVVPRPHHLRLRRARARATARRAQVWRALARAPGPRGRRRRSSSPGASNCELRRRSPTSGCTGFYLEDRTFAARPVRRPRPADRPAAAR